ncbi:MAG TPA: porin [Rhodocyclaceae bacterium]
MNFMKKIVPAAIALAFAGAAQAQVSIYGLIDMSVGKNEVVDGKTAKTDIHSGGDDSQSQGNSTTRIGVKGSFDVDKDVKAHFKFETNGITSNGAVNGPAFFNRQAWLGFSHTKMGEIRVGRQDSIPFQVMGAFDFNGQSNGATSAYSGVGVWATDRQSRSVQYISPEMSGFKAQVGYVPRGDNTDLRDASTYDDNTRGVASAAVTYSGIKNLVIGASHEGKKTLNGEDFNSVAASYDFGFLKAMAGYTDAGLNATGPTLGVTAPVAGFTMGAHVAQNKDTKAKALELFINREIFKNTYAYAEALRLDNKAPAVDLNSYAVGVIFVF